MSASGGCPPYSWSLSGSGTLTPSGSGNTNATYQAPASNPDCANNAMITLKDSCRNSKSVGFAVNCITSGTWVLAMKVWNDGTPYTYDSHPYCSLDGYIATYCPDCSLHSTLWRCDGTVYSDCTEAMHPNPCGDHVVDISDPWYIFGGMCWCMICQCPGASVSGNNCSCGWDMLCDLRSQTQKNQGCCPVNPLTGLPFDGGFVDSESTEKNGGRPPTRAPTPPPSGCPTNQDVSPSDVTVGNPTNVATGNKYEELLDLSISTPGLPLEFRRSYNSQITFDAPLGFGWTHTFDMILNVVQTSPTQRVRIWDSDGRALYFNQVQQTSNEILFGGESGVKNRLKQVISSGDYYLRRKEGNLTYRFDSTGKLLEISDPNGNTQTFTYTGGLLTQVSDNFGKSLSIQYTNNRISSVTDPKNQSVVYEYTNGDLTRVTYPDQNFISYAYSNHNLTDKYDTNNNLFGHWGYDNRQRVTNYYSHMKDGVHQEEINLTYQPGSTIVTKSTGTTTYTTAFIDSINVVQEIQGCSTCGSTHKSFSYSNRLDLTQVTSIDGTNQYRTQYTYDNPTNPWEQVGETLQKTEAVGWPEQRITSYTYTHRTDDPFLLTQSTETVKSVVNPQQNKVTTISYDNQ
ncbi:MAG TPA: DUF6531 domain-containing protein, partial [Thermodesulfobacteriota bacterium]|nr:DUF6531 domain-containing protein [Thermodesulfobacteriota bacterium]